MTKDIYGFIIAAIALLILCLVVGYKLFGSRSKKIVIILYVIFIVFVLFSHRILEFPVVLCKGHTKGKNFFELSFDSRYNIFNPSITKTSNGYLCCLRCSTLTQKNLFYHFYGQMFYKSFILFLEIDSEGNKKIIYPVHKNLKGSLEDPRMIEYKGNYVLSASEYITMQDNFPVLMIYDKNYNFVRRVDYNRSDYFGDSPVVNVQKNWCPFEHNGELCIQTDAYPIWKVFTVDLQTGRMFKIIEENVANFFDVPQNLNLRCSTSWKIYNDSYYICGLHTKTKGKIPTIRSVLVLIDRKTLLISFRTEILCLEPKKHNRIQYLSGIEVDDFYVILAYGLNDSQIILKKIPKYRLNFISCHS